MKRAPTAPARCRAPSQLSIGLDAGAAQDSECRIGETREDWKADKGPEKGAVTTDHGPVSDVGWEVGTYPQRLQIGVMMGSLRF